MSTDSKYLAIRPSIALPTGPFDWHPERHSRAVYEARVEKLRAVMAERGLTHVVVHGNGFDHAALFWLTHFTPKLGPAYALVPLTGQLRLLFAGGPGMKPSALRLTWVEDVTAIKSVQSDVKRWLDEAAPGTPVRLGLIEGSAMLRGDWRSVVQAAGEAIELDADLDRRREPEPATPPVKTAASETLSRVLRAIIPTVQPGDDLRHVAIALERAAYAEGSQDVRVLAGRRPGGAPTTLPDEAVPIFAATWLEIHLRQDGEWSTASFRLKPHD